LLPLSLGTGTSFCPDFEGIEAKVKAFAQTLVAEKGADATKAGPVDQLVRPQIVLST